MAAPIGDGVPEKAPTKKFDSLSSTLFYRTIPLAGGFSYTVFSTNVANPALFKGLFGAHDFVVANALWFNSHLGTGLYLYNSEHLRRASKLNRIIYSVFGAVMFNFGSVLFWAATKQQLPNCKELRMIYACTTAVALLHLGKKYITHIDTNISEVD